MNSLRWDTLLARAILVIAAGTAIVWAGSAYAAVIASSAASPASNG